MLSHETLVYELKVTLKGSKPPIWRRILVKSDTRLSKLHDILQAAMGWEDCHLHQFEVGGVYYGVRDPAIGLEVKDERRASLNNVLSAEKQKITYEYDMGDSWEHEILLEKILPLDAKIRYPVCVTGKRACPPEDCGGVWGYADLLEILADPNHPEREDRLDWLGDEFDPEAFDLEEVNRTLREIP